MSEKVDAERREANRVLRIEVGKGQLRLAQLVLTAYVEGCGIAETARRINRSRTVAWKLRVWLGVQSGRQQHGKTGRRATKSMLEAVRP